LFVGLLTLQHFVFIVVCSVKKEHNVHINSGIDCQYFLFIVSLLIVEYVLTCLWSN